jgi:hypothetical protein
MSRFFSRALDNLGSVLYILEILEVVPRTEPVANRPLRDPYEIERSFSRSGSAKIFNAAKEVRSLLGIFTSVFRDPGRFGL